MDLTFPDFDTELAAGIGRLGMGGGVDTEYDGDALASLTHSSRVFINVSQVADNKLVHSSNFCNFKNN